MPSGLWSFFTLSDGSGNRQTEEWFAKNLMPAVVGAMADLYSKLNTLSPYSPSASIPPNEDVQKAMTDMLSVLQDECPRPVTATPDHNLGTASTAGSEQGNVVLFYDSYSRQLHLASTAISLKAFLARRNRDGERYASTPALLEDNAHGRTMSSELVTAPRLSPFSTTVAIQPGDILILGSSSLQDVIQDPKTIRLIQRCEEEPQDHIALSDSLDTVRNFWTPRPIRWVFGDDDRVSAFGRSSMTRMNTASLLIQSAYDHPQGVHNHQPDLDDPKVPGRYVKQA